MSVIRFICPDNTWVRIEDCLRCCTNSQRCMFLSTLRAVANSLDRQISEPTVTELIAGTRETFLKKRPINAVDPASVLYALHWQAVHSINERRTQGEILSENNGVLGDLKIISSFKFMKALDIYKAKVDTGEVYKSGVGGNFFFFDR